MSIKVVVLDIDDTLYLERDYVRSGFAAVGHYVLQEHGLAGFGETCWSLFEQGVRGNTFDQATSMHGIDLPIAELTNVYRCHEPQIELLPDARDFLNAIQHLGTAIITDGPPESQRAKIRALGLSKWISSFIITSESGDEWAKPAPRAFQHVEHVFGVNGSDLCYVADNPIKDFIGAQERGWSCVRVRRAGSLHSTAVTSIGVTEVSDFADVELGDL